MTMPRTRFLQDRRWLLAVLAALGAALYLVALWPAPAHFASCVPHSLAAENSRVFEMAGGDHLQLIYHFELLGDYIRGVVPWFSDLWEFNTSDADRPPRPDGCYAPFALPYVALRAVGATDAFAYNAVSLLSAILGVILCFALARRCGAGRRGALLAAAIAGCVPYRWVTLATGSPTGFGMGIVPAVALGLDIALRDGRARGGAIAGVSLLLLWMSDLHCFFFSTLAIPLWVATSLIIGPRGGATSPRPARLLRAMLPFALCCVAVVLAVRLTGSGYAGTNVEAGRTLDSVMRHSPKWSSLIRPDPAGVLPGHLHVGLALPILGALVTIVFGTVAMRGGLARRSHAGNPPCRRMAFAGLLLALAIVLSFLVSVGTNGPFRGLPILLLRAAVPRFNMIRQPVKVLCLLPTLCAAFFGLCLAILCRLRRPPRLAPALSLAIAAIVAIDARLGTVVGVDRLVGENAAYAAAVGAARARGQTPRAIVLPIFRGDAVLNAPYLYWARISRLRMLNGYTAVWSYDYEENIASRFRTMEEGDLSDDQVAGLRAMGVNSVIVHEDLLACLRSLAFPGGATLRRMLANPRLRFLAVDRGVWSFELLPDDEKAAVAPFAPSVETALRHRHYDGGKGSGAQKIRSAAEIHTDGYGWLVRASAGATLKIVSRTMGEDGGKNEVFTLFPPIPDSGRHDFRLCFLPAQRPGADRVIRSSVRGKARVTDAMFASAMATNGFHRVCFADLYHRWGETILGEDGQPAGIRFSPGRAPACHAVAGPFLPPAPDMREVRLESFSASRILPDGTDLGPPAISVVRPDGTSVPLNIGDALPGDGTEPVSFDVEYDPADGATLELRELVLGW